MVVTPMLLMVIYCQEWVCNTNSILREKYKNKSQLLPRTHFPIFPFAVFLKENRELLLFIWGCVCLRVYVCLYVCVWNGVFNGDFWPLKPSLAGPQVRPVHHNHEHNKRISESWRVSVCVFECLCVCVPIMDANGEILNGQAKLWPCIMAFFISQCQTVLQEWVSMSRWWVCVCVQVL